MQSPLLTISELESLMNVHSSETLNDQTLGRRVGSPLDKGHGIYEELKRIIREINSCDINSIPHTIRLNVN